MKELVSTGFTLHEQAKLRRSGVEKPSRVLDQEKLDLLRVQPTRHKHNPRLRHGQIISTRPSNRVFTRRIAVAIGIDPRNDAESVLTSRTFAE
ncbi:hypothetical protein DPMN_083668 [Dreissena polymorpha]|uniref:Uncharacterized protein n=1 Tax=Dreissena polymorpha TaxID=45954 RepID=A0A9D4BK30_DREPO|nr:hypothetical protein DPMN_083668 [Dreissena polymorpha]